MGISVWEERVPFVTSSIQGSRVRPGRLKDRERHGTGDKDEKSVNGTQISFGKFPGHRENSVAYHLLGKTGWSTVVVNGTRQYNIFPDWKFPQGCARSIYKTVP